MYIVFTCMPGEFVFTCMPGELPQVTQVFVVVLVLRISSANERPCVLILRLSACLFPVSLGCCQHVMSTVSPGLLPL